MPNYPSPHAKDVIRLRAKAGLTLDEAARAAFASRQSWRKWESGARHMPRATWELVQITVARRPVKYAPAPNHDPRT